eukprot:6380598-Prymnesium_polylepis.1
MPERPRRCMTAWPAYSICTCVLAVADRPRTPNNLHKAAPAAFGTAQQTSGSVASFSYISKSPRDRLSFSW